MSDDNGGRRTEDLSLTVDLITGRFDLQSLQEVPSIRQTPLPPQKQADLIREPSFWSAIMATKASENTSLPKVRDNLAGLLDSRVGLGRGGGGV